MNCLIVDDEPAARNGLAEDIKVFDFLTVVGLAENASVALQFVNGPQPIDLLFMDIDMPGLNGLDFLKLLPVKPLVIITTAYPQFAIDGFDLGVIDYLLKPISMERLETAVNKARDWLALKENHSPENTTNEFLYLKCNGRYEKILFTDILYIEAANNYVFLHTAEKRFITYNTLKGIEEQLPGNMFVRVHKSYIVSCGHIDKVNRLQIIVSKTPIPLSRNFRGNFQKNILNERALKRN
jgi:two-component system LytT family response regulator